MTMTSPRALPSGEPASLGFLLERLERLHRRMQQFVDTGLHAGVSLLLVRNGQVADFFAAGFQNQELGLPMARDTIVRVYSMTKIVVSAAALALLEEGRIGLLDPVADYLPEFRDLQVLVGGTVQNPQLVPADKPLTIQHLFTHTSGLIYEAPDELIGQFYRPLEEEDGQDPDALNHITPSLETLVNRLSRLPLKWHPGTRFEYGYSTDVLGRVIEVVTGLRLDAFLKDRILNPLGMIDTDYAVTEAKKERLAKVYEHGLGGALKPVPPLPGEKVEGQRNFPGGGSGLFSTLDDFARFGQMLCNGGELAGSRILGRKTVQLMVTNHLTGLADYFHNLATGYGFGLGVGIRLDDGLAATLGTIGTYGWNGMATTYCWIDPAEKLVTLCFTQHLPHNEHGLFQRFANLAYQALG
jgi:CubicO group peptidase (beta-lactamase class C family)